MANLKLTRKIIDLHNSWYNRAVPNIDIPNGVAPAILFSVKTDAASLEERAKQFQAQLSQFIDKYENATDLAKEELNKKAAVAYQHLQQIFTNILIANIVDHQQIIFELKKLTTESRNPIIKAKLRAFDQMYSDYRNFRKEKLDNPELTNSIIEQQYQQMRYDPLGRIAAYLMGTYIDQLYLSKGLAPLPEPKPKQGNEDQGAVNNMLLEQLRANMAAGGGRTI
jgi:hypothetical protein